MGGVTASSSHRKGNQADIFNSIPQQGWFNDIYCLILVGQTSRSKHGRSHFKPVTKYYNTKFHPNWMKNTVGENFCYWSVLVSRAGRPKNGHGHFKLILWCLWAITSPHNKFHPNWMKNTVENFCYWSILVGRAGRSEDGCSRFKKLNLNQRLTNDISIKFQPNRMKIDDVSLL